MKFNNCNISNADITEQSEFMECIINLSKIFNAELKNCEITSTTLIDCKIFECEMQNCSIKYTIDEDEE